MLKSQRFAYARKKSSPTMGLKIIPHVQRNLPVFYHFERPRLNHLFTEAVRYPIVMVCAGAGYGKTNAVQDFVKGYGAATAWLQFSERDNMESRFWENFTHSAYQINRPFYDELSKLDFPDTPEKFNKYQALLNKHRPPLEKRIYVMDDVHILENPVVINFLERFIQNLPIETSMIIISRSTPRLNLNGLISSGSVFNISEEDLCFSENEMTHYFHKLDIFPDTEGVREIMQDTGGWAFALNLILRSYHKVPAYKGYLRNAIKTNIFRLMETEVWDGISERVKLFMIRLSLIDHLSYELIELLAKGDKKLIAEMERQNAYLRRDSYINAYLIHHLFLEFLATKQELLSEEQKRETYAIAGEWCYKHNFKIDALSYYEKIGDYGMTVFIIYSMPISMHYDIAKYCMAIFERAPPETFDTVLNFASAYIRCCARVGLGQRAIELAKFYEAKFLKLPKDDPFRIANLGVLYFLWSHMRNTLCLVDGVFDFDIYLDKFCKCKGMPDAMRNHPNRVRLIGPWANANGSSGKGAPQKYIEAVARASAYMPDIFNGYMGGEYELVQGELKFFQGELEAAEAFLAQSLIKAKEHRQYEIYHRALMYILRLSIAQGNFEKAQQVINDAKAQLDEIDYSNRYVEYDITLAMYYYSIGLPEKMPEWLKQDISPYSFANVIENFGNILKVRYFYAVRNFLPVLAYIQEMRQRESYLYGRVYMFVIEACVHYFMKDKEKAFAVLLEAYKTASPNELTMPFIELGKDMRSLTAAALKKADFGIPKSWLENINRKASSYAKRQSSLITMYRQENRISTEIILSPRETEILKDLAHGLSRAEVAVNKGLSINTVKMVINSIYYKLAAENIADLIRIAMEKKLI